MDDQRSTVGSLAAEHVVYVEARATLRTVIEHLVDAAVGLVVVTDGGSIVGVVSERDVISAMHRDADLDEVWAADVMTEDLIVADAADDVVTAARQMLANGARHILVTGQGEASWGVVSLRDVVGALIDD